MISRDITIERLATASDLLLAPFELNEASLGKTLALIAEHQVDDADLYFQYTRSEGWSLEEGIVKTGSFSIDQGVGVRAVAGERTAFAYSDDISLASLTDAAQTVRAIGSGSRGGKVKLPSRRVAGARALYLADDPIGSLDSTAKVALLEKVEQLARAKDPRVVQVMAGLASEYDVVLIARLDGTLAADVRPLVRLSVTVIAEQNGRREVGSFGGGGRFGLAYFDDAMVTSYVDEAVGAALTNLESRPAPAGAMTVVLGPGWPGVLLHEAVGHGLEGDFNRKGSSAFSGRIGQRVAAKGVTVLDDGTLADRRGSLNVDDEGHATQRNVLIEDGILKGYIQDAMNARRQGSARNRGQHQKGLVRHQLWRGPGRHHQRQVRVFGQRGVLGRKRQNSVPGQGRHHRRQRAGVVEEDHHDRQRHAAGFRRGHLRQGRPERARRCRPADAAHRWHDGGRYRLSGCFEIESASSAC